MIFIRALVFGVTLAIAIGPIAVLIIRYAATDGLQAGFASACGAAFGDLTYATVALSIGSTIAPLLRVHAAQAHYIAAMTLVIFGFWLAWTAIRSSPVSYPTLQVDGSRRGLAPFVTTYGLTVANPLTAIAFLAFVGQLPLDTTTVTRVLGAAGLFTGSLCVQFILALGGALLGRLLTAERGLRTLNVVSGTGIALFGIIGLLG